MLHTTHPTPSESIDSSPSPIWRDLALSVLVVFALALIAGFLTATR